MSAPFLPSKSFDVQQASLHIGETSAYLEVYCGVRGSYVIFVSPAFVSGGSFLAGNEPLEFHVLRDTNSRFATYSLVCLAPSPRSCHVLHLHSPDGSHRRPAKRSGEVDLCVDSASKQCKPGC
nr:NS protein [Avian orthoreovirus]